MNAKELRKAAERLRREFDEDAESPYGNASDIAVQLEQNDMACLFNHILATVRDDDDELVTIEGLVALGGVRSGLGSVQSGWWVDFSEGVSFRFVSDSLNDVMMNHIYWMSDISEALIPRNMKEARELLERCGAIGGGK